MSYITTRVAPCLRFVLVRNAQCKKHIPQQGGDFTEADTAGTPSILTDNGEEMAKSLSDLINYLDQRPFCVPDDKVPPSVYNVIIDSKAPQHAATAQYISLSKDNIKIISIDDIYKFVTHPNILKKFTDQINYCIVFTDGGTINKIIKDYFHLSNCMTGPALGSCTTFDIGFYTTEGPFLHEFGSLAALQYGGYDTSKLFWWNNSA